MKRHLILFLLAAATVGVCSTLNASDRVRVLVTSDGEIDDQCSMIRFLLYANECDVEGIISSASQYHAHGHNWAGDDWIDPDLAAYAQVYPNLVKHDPNYPTPEYLRERTVLGNVKAEGDMEEPTAGSDLIVKVLLDETDDRPVWLQAWGGMNTIARALKTIEEDYPDRMAEAAAKCRFFFIWEQDNTYQDYIRPVWGKYEIPTIISDQFEAIAYRWKQAQPKELHPYFEGAWMKENILENHGPLTAIYAAHDNGDFRSEGDSPAFLHTIVTGLRNMESPDWGGWGGRYVRVRENTWLDPVPVNGYSYPGGRWYGNTGWGRNSLRNNSTSTPEQRKEYFKPMWRWTAALQNDFAARADWCVKSYDEANHPPVIKLGHGIDLKAKPGETVKLSAGETTDPDGDKLNYHWWQYEEADTYNGAVEIKNEQNASASFTVPDDVVHAKTIHIICEVTDTGSPAITRYQRVVVEVDAPLEPSDIKLNANGVAELPPMTAHFTMDGGNDNKVIDAVSGATGALKNADPAVSWIDGPVNGAVHLDGEDDRIIVPHNEGFDFGNESFSITFWMKWPEGLPTGHEHILTKGDYETSFPGELGKRYEIYVSSGNLRFNIDDDRNKSQIQVSMDPYTTGEWVHVAAVRDTKARRLKLYANGALLPPSNPGNPNNDGTDVTGNISNPVALYIGDASREDAPFQGDMGDLRFYRSALSDGQVAALAAKAQLIEKEPAVVVEKAPVRVARESELPPMTAYFPLNEGQGLKLKEAISGVETMLENGDADTAWTSSDNGLALKMDGVDDRIIVPNAPGFDFADESFSVAFHMRWTKEGAPRHEHVLCKGDYDTSVNGESGRRWEINMTSEGFQFIVDDNVNKSQIQVSNEYILKGFWVHVVAVRDTESKQLKLYVNGELQGSTDPANILYNGVDQTGNITNPRELLIGDSSRRDNPFNGEFSDIRIYRTALNESEVAGTARLKRRASANPEHGFAGAKVPMPEMSAHFPFDEGAGAVVSDVISGARGSLHNADTSKARIEGVLGGALDFDGENDHVIVPHDPAFDFGAEDFSVSFYMRWPKEMKPGHEHIMTKGDYDSSVEGETGKRWEITFIGIGVCFIVDDDVDLGRSSILVSFDPFITGEWVHVAMVRDTQSKRIRAYVNGVEQESIRPDEAMYDGVDRAGNISNPQDLFIGDASRLDNPFPGDIDDIRIFRTALTEPQIASIAPKSLTSNDSGKPRIIVTSDGEIDDQCSMIRFLLYANEWDIEGIITSSSQYHWQGHNWAGDDWIEPDLNAYEQVYPNLLKHDPDYPTPEYLRSITLLGNVKAEGEMEEVTAGSQHIVNVLLDETDDDPIWLQAWGGMNTIARALKTIEEKHPEKMAYVASKVRFFFIWEQDNTYQDYIKPHWGKYNIQTIISDQFVAFFYTWDRTMPPKEKKFYEAEWMNANILKDHGPLCSLYAAHDGEKSGYQVGDFRSEGDTPAFLFNINNGLRSSESPEWGGWAGRYVRVRENTWLDPVAEPGYQYPGGRWYTSSAWGRQRLRKNILNDEELAAYLKPIWRWSEALQNDFASRADWCVKSYEEGNHPPVVVLGNALDMKVQPGAQVKLSAQGTSDPDGDALTYRWWQYEEADSYHGTVEIQEADKPEASFTVPDDAGEGKTIHVICEVTDSGTPPLTRYQRVIVEID